MEHNFFLFREPTVTAFNSIPRLGEYFP